MINAKIRGKHEAQEHVSTIHYVTELTHGNGGTIFQSSNQSHWNNGRNEENC